jgi:hypothetical protein
LAAAVVLAGIVCAGCGLGPAKAKGPEPISCGENLRASYGGQSVELVSCAGNVGFRPLPHVRLARGEVLRIRGLGTSYDRAASSNPRSLKPVTADSTVADFTAVAAGRSVISVNTIYCTSRHSGVSDSPRPCDAIVVVVE